MKYNSDGTIVGATNTTATTTTQVQVKETGNYKIPANLQNAVAKADPNTLLYNIISELVTSKIFTVRQVEDKILNLVNIQEYPDLTKERIAELRNLGDPRL